MFRALRRLRHEQPESRHVFLTERRSPISPPGFRKLIVRTGEGSKFPFPVHPHMLRHACGDKFANAGQDTRALCSTISGTRTSSTRCAARSCRRSDLDRLGKIDGPYWWRALRQVLPAALRAEHGWDFQYTERSSRLAGRCDRAMAALFRERTRLWVAPARAAWRSPLERVAWWPSAVMVARRHVDGREGKMRSCKLHAAGPDGRQ